MAREDIYKKGKQLFVFSLAPFHDTDRYDPRPVLSGGGNRTGHLSDSCDRSAANHRKINPFNQGDLKPMLVKLRTIDFAIVTFITAHQCLQHSTNKGLKCTIPYVLFNIFVRHV